MKLKHFLFAAVVASPPARAVDIVNDPIHTATSASKWVQNYAQWLTQLNTISAFASAPPAHGGQGALLVLLRPHPAHVNNPPTGR